MAYEDLILENRQNHSYSNNLSFFRRKKVLHEYLSTQNIIPFISLYVDHTVCNKNLKRRKNFAARKALAKNVRNLHDIVLF